MTLIADLFMKLRTPKNVAGYMSKKSRFKGPLTCKLVTAFKHCLDVNDSTVVRFSDHFEGN